MLQQLPPLAPETIVVTGKALPEAKADRAFSVQTINRKQLQQSPSHELDQILKDVPGLQLFRRSDARSGHPTSQGVTLRALGGNASSRALLILDGVPQSDPFGGWVNWPAYDPATLDQVRVTRGGGSVANGAGALAGTIEMTSRLDRGVSAGAEVGSRDSEEVRTALGFDAAGGLLSLSARGERGDGFIPLTAGTRGPADQRAPYRQGSARAHWVGEVGPATELQMSLDGFRDQRSRGLAFTGNRTNGADASLRLVGRGAWQWTALAYGQWRNLRSSFANVNVNRTVATRVSLQDSVPSHGYGGSFELRPPVGGSTELRFGADVRATDGESRELYSYVAGQPTRRRRAGGETLSSGLFGEATAELGRLTLTSGGRVDYWRIADGRLFEQQIATGAALRNDIYPDRHGWLPTARAGAVLDLTHGFSIRSAAYLGWRLPTLNELFRPFRAGQDATAANPLLNPERLAGAETGVRYAEHGLTLELTGFVNRLGDAIANVTLGQGPGVFPGVGFVAAGGEYRQRENVDAIKVDGLEASARLTRGPWSVGLGASYSEAKVEASGAAAPLDGLRPAQTPKTAGSLFAGWERDGRSASLVLRYVGPQFEDDLNQRELKGATTLDGYFAWPLSHRLQLVARGENLFNTLVEAGINSDGSIERATPRTLWLGLRLDAQGIFTSGTP